MSKGNSGYFKKTTGYDKHESTIKNRDQALTKKLSDPGFYVGVKGGVLLGKYKKWIGVNRRNRLMKKAKDAELKNAVNQLYRPGAMIGDGGTASVLKFEKATGLGVAKNGRSHTIKAENTIKYLKRILEKQTLSKSDRKLANKLLKDLIKALRGTKK